MQVPTLSKKVDEMALCRARRPGMLSHSAQVPSMKLSAKEKEDEVEEEVEGVGASGSDVSIDIGDEPVVF